MDESSAPRQQAASVRLIRSQGKDSCRISRKEIKVNVGCWFELTSAAVTRSLRALMRPPLELIEMIKAPQIGTAEAAAIHSKGQAFSTPSTSKQRRHWRRRFKTCHLN
jgi:hypothetical protein